MIVRNRWRAAWAAIVMLAGQGSAALAEADRPLPRFVSLRSNEVNVRTGPGQRYPILWVFQRAGMPVEVIQEFEHWRKIRDWEGGEGWLHQSTISGDRSVLVTGDVRTLRNQPGEGAVAVAQAEPGVIGELLECADAWCRVDLMGFRGWLRRAEMWGVYPDEKVD